MENPYINPTSKIEKEGEDGRTVIFYKRNELRETAYKLASIFLLIDAVVTLTTICVSVRYRGGSAWWGIVPFLAMAFTSYACYANSRRYTDLESDSLAIDGKILGNLFSVGICLMGVYFITSNIARLAVDAYLIVLKTETLGPANRSEITALFPRAMEIGFGIYFILGGRSLARMLIKLNHKKG